MLSDYEYYIDRILRNFSFIDIVYIRRLKYSMINHKLISDFCWNGIHLLDLFHDILYLTGNMPVFRYTFSSDCHLR